jgi:hypothetical protein
LLACIIEPLLLVPKRNLQLVVEVVKAGAGAEAGDKGLETEDVIAAC